MEKKKFDWKKFVVNIDQYISAILFIVIMVLLFMQVVSRYVFRHSFTWTEELSVILFVWMTYAGVSSAITYRKNLRIDALLNAVPFKAKKVMLIISDVVCIVFDIYLIFPFLQLINGIGSAKTPILGIPRALSYWLIPFIMVVCVVKLVADIFKLAKEDEKNLGASKPSLDLDACEREYQAKVAAKKEGN